MSYMCTDEKFCVGVVGGCHHRGLYRNIRYDLFKDEAVKPFKSLLKVK